jgi:hypothetical protein
MLVLIFGGEKGEVPIDKRGALNKINKKYGAHVISRKQANLEATC